MLNKQLCSDYAETGFQIYVRIKLLNRFGPIDIWLKLAKPRELFKTKMHFLDIQISPAGAFKS